LANEYNLLEHGCKFHSTDLAAGDIIDEIQWTSG